MADPRLVGLKPGPLGLFGFGQGEDPGTLGVNSLIGRLKEKIAASSRTGLQEQAGLASDFAGTGEAGFGARGTQIDDAVSMLQKLARGEESFSAEQLRQAAGRNISGAQALGASARPGQEAGAARMAAQQASQIGAGLAGQQALAGIAERQAAQQALGNLLTTTRGQDLQAALGGRGLSIEGLAEILRAKTAQSGQPSTFDKLLGGAVGLGSAFALSDERAKQGIRGGQEEADRFIQSLTPKSFEMRGGGGTITQADVENIRRQGAAPGTPVVTPLPQENVGIRGPSGITHLIRIDRPTNPQEEAQQRLGPIEVSALPEGERQLGVMAQNVEQTPAGRQIVGALPGGLKALDVPKLAGALAASVGRIGERLAELEKQRNRKMGTGERQEADLLSRRQEQPRGMTAAERREADLSSRRQAR